MENFKKNIGLLLGNRYQLTRIIGIGGMAVVYEAKDIQTNRFVAVKVLKDEIATDTQALKRFVNESKAIAMLSHPNIVRIYDISVKEKFKYIVMELLNGVTLKNYITQKGRLGIDETISYSEQILMALAHAHSRGIIHRDIKPQNILLLKNGQIKVTDFGIAKLPNAETVTLTDKAIGTVFYISPEQVSGKPITPRSDLYSLGILMYEMLTSHLPFTADSPVSVALKQINDIPRSPRELNPEIPRGLEQIILTSMEKDPAARFQNAGQMLKALKRIESNHAYVFRPHRTDAGKLLSGDEVKTKTPKKKTTHKSPTKSKKKTPPKKTKRVSHSMLPIILGVSLALLIIVIVCAIFALKALFGGEKSYEIITVPNLVGEMVDEYKDNLVKEGYNVKIVYENSFEEPGTILEQDPIANSKKKLSATQPQCDLTLTISAGAKPITIEDYTMASRREVKNTLENKGLHVEEVGVFSDFVGYGYVVSTSPKEGSILAEGSTITIYWSKGRDTGKVTMPSLLGKTESAALAEMTNRDLLLGNIHYIHSDLPIGTVVRQSPDAGSQIQYKTMKIDLYISIGKASIIPDDTTAAPIDPTPPDDTTEIPSDTTSPPDTEDFPIILPPPLF